MLIKLTESRGREPIKVPGTIPEKMYHAIIDGSVEKTCRYALLTLAKIQSVCKDDEHAINDVFGLMSEFAEAKSADDANRCLRELYDLCDAYGIILDVPEVPDDSEVKISAPSDVSVSVRDVE